MIKLWWALVALQIGDLATTFLGLRLGAEEKNPVGVAALGMGFEGLILAKCLAMAVALMFAACLVKWGGVRYARRGLALSVVMMGAVVIFNGFTILRHSMGGWG